ncbi:hypothetical protein B296_00003840 [Ensete ventricosum]|uniref:Pectinesterase catalytic domain-containing protein n=1 Tax=Ensete ventricosum TaxID=4639 RepID=A0A427ADP9_ENSVE|nr:hypothetical protein B296_00003840 [Ensete ventricosum]
MPLPCSSPSSSATFSIILYFLGGGPLLSPNSESSACTAGHWRRIGSFSRRLSEASLRQLHPIFFSCSFNGHQNTLYVHSLLQFYRKYNVADTIDFGNAVVVFQDCKIKAPFHLFSRLFGRSDPRSRTRNRFHPTDLISSAGSRRNRDLIQ